MLIGEVRRAYDGGYGCGTLLTALAHPTGAA